LGQHMGQQHFEPSGCHLCANVDNQRVFVNAGDAKMGMQIGGQQAFDGGVQLLPIARALQKVG